ncbi:putative leucine-rich repeat receptor-like serine/threonine-protein kinase [Senna tora]|uniref:Putative leucine-rich repeat receptor-like serine/threonine-protein kinase n=1 Tax=Senna tora TaxID=362788 RepID=A0A834T5J4_9FABA|nr:putative leucine-rich repeat receptor-like serine/threonine-protein kinase [Senna tora]
MERALQWNIVWLSLWLAFVQVLLNAHNTVVHARKLSTDDPHPGFISIDCGSPNDYLDEESGIWYQSDTNFTETGTNTKVVPNANLDYPYFGGLLNTLRSFPEGKRNCYTLKPKQGKNHKYLIRAYFAYGNYDGKNQTPIFDLYVGVNYWDTVNLGKYYYISEIIHTPTTDTIHVCLVKTVVGIPFISALELRPLNNSIYQTPLPSSQSLLINQGMFDVASTNIATHSRYKDDIYDRLWRTINVPYWYQLNGSVDIDPATTNDPYKLPSQVLRSAAQSYNLSYSLNFDYDSIWKDLDLSSLYYVYFHFAEIEKLPDGHKRIMNISLYNDQTVLSVPVTLEYLEPVTISPQYSTQSFVQFSITAASQSAVPPILNAFELMLFWTSKVHTISPTYIGKEIHVFQRTMLGTELAATLTKPTIQGSPHCKCTLPGNLNLSFN